MAKEPETLAELHAAEQSQQNTTPATTPEPDATPEAEPAEAKPAPESAPEPEPTDEGDTPILDWLKEQVGVDVGKYKSDEEALRGLGEAVKLVGKRDEDAEYGRQIRQLMQGREAEIIEQLRNGSKKAAEPAEPTGDKSSDVPEYNPQWRYQVVTDEKGNLVPAQGAPKDVVEKLQKYNEWLEKRIHELARSEPADKVLAKKIADIDKIIEQKLETEIQRRTVVSALATWEAENKTDIYANGKNEEGGLTPLGQEIAKQAELLAEKGVADPIARLNIAKELAVAKHQQITPPPKKLSAKSLRKPALATSEHDADRSDDELLENMSLAELYAFRQKHKK